MSEVKGMATCKVCGRDFALIAEEHYVARGLEKGAVSVLVSGNEPELFDAFDCPHCGCQNVMQKRQRDFEEEFEIEIMEEDCCMEEHGDCDGCKHEDKKIGDEPCIYCKKSYKDCYERREE